MKKNEFTPEQKKAYFDGLRQKWNEAKSLAETSEIAAIYRQLNEMGIADISRYNVSLIMMQAAALGLTGLPYIDFKTYKGWQEAGFQVKRGEASQVMSLTWVGPRTEDGEPVEGAHVYPKATSLFHTSQVEPIIQ